MPDAITELGLSPQLAPLRGGLSRFVAVEETLDEALSMSEVSKRNKGDQIVQVTPKIGRFTAFSAMKVKGGKEGVKPGWVYPRADYDAGKLNPDPVIDDFDLVHFLKKIDKACDTLKLPNTLEMALVLSRPQGGGSPSGWMWPGTRVVYLNRKPSPTATSKYGAWKAPRSPHTMVHEYGHTVWYSALSPEQRKAVAAYYKAHVAPDPKAAKAAKTTPTPYGATKVEEWWAECVGYAMYGPGKRISTEVFKFLQDVLSGKTTASKVKSALSGPAASDGEKEIDLGKLAGKPTAAGKKVTVTTPAPPDEPTKTSKAVLHIQKNDAALKKAVGDYGVEIRTDGTARVIPAKDPRSRDVQKKLMAVLGLAYKTPGSSGLQGRYSTGKSGGVVVHEGLDEGLTFSPRLRRVAKTLRNHGLDHFADELQRAAKAGERFEVRQVADEIKSVANRIGGMRKLLKARDLILQELEDTLVEVSPPGWKGTVKAMKRDQRKGKMDPGINPWALAWWMHKRGAKPHYKDKPPYGKKDEMADLFANFDETDDSDLRTRLIALFSHSPGVSYTGKQAAQAIVAKESDVRTALAQLVRSKVLRFVRGEGFSLNTTGKGKHIRVPANLKRTISRIDMKRGLLPTKTRSLRFHRPFECLAAFEPGQATTAAALAERAGIPVSDAIRGLVPLVECGVVEFTCGQYLCEDPVAAVGLVEGGQWHLRWTESENHGPVKTLTRSFPNEAARARFVEKLRDKVSFVEILSYGDPQGETLEEAKTYTAKDALGNKHSVEMQRDSEDGTYVASVRGGRFRRMASGAERQPIRAIGSGATPAAAIKDLERKLREDLDEGEATDAWDAWKSWTVDERIVFAATVGWKAGYGGDKDSRFNSAAKATGITREEWDKARAGLIRRGVFNKGGAVKPKWKKDYYAALDLRTHLYISQGASGGKRRWESVDAFLDEQPDPGMALLVLADLVDEATRSGTVGGFRSGGDPDPFGFSQGGPGGGPPLNSPYTVRGKKKKPKAPINVGSVPDVTDDPAHESRLKLSWKRRDGARIARGVRGRYEITKEGGSGSVLAKHPGQKRWVVRWWPKQGPAYAKFLAGSFRDEKAAMRRAEDHDADESSPLESLDEKKSSKESMLKIRLRTSKPSPHIEMMVRKYGGRMGSVEGHTLPIFFKGTDNRTAFLASIKKQNDVEEVEEEALGEDMMVLLGLGLSTLVGVPVGKSVIKVLRTVKALLHAGKESAAEKAWSKISRGDQKKVVAWAKKQKPTGRVRECDVFVSSDQLDQFLDVAQQLGVSDTVVADPADDGLLVTLEAGQADAVVAAMP